MFAPLQDNAWRGKRCLLPDTVRRNLYPRQRLVCMRYDCAGRPRSDETLVIDEIDATDLMTRRPITKEERLRIREFAAILADLSTAPIVPDPPAFVLDEMDATDLSTRRPITREERARIRELAAILQDLQRR